jgi:murein DD-endopeptidase MepM/ murein hydrolase activator NlpD
MGFLEDLFGQLGGRPRPAAPIDVFGSGGLDAYGDLMGDGSDALQPITPFGTTGGFSGGLGSRTSSPSSFWQMPQLGGGIGTGFQGGFSQRLPIVKSTGPVSTPRVFGRKAAAQTTGTTSTPPSGSTDTYNLPNVSANVTRWYPLAKKYADQEGVPVEAIMAIIQNESGGQPGARSGVNPGDQGRAVGLMQLIPKYHGQDGADLTDPEINIQRGVRYFAQAYKKRGNDLNKAMAEYFGGGGAFDAAGNIRPDVGDINITIGRYLPKFQAVTAAYKTWLDRQGQAPSAAAQTFQTGGQWDHLVPGGQGRIERGGTHGGWPAIDIFAKAGTPILAPTDGVSEPGQYPLGGNASTLRGSDGRFYYFAHAQAPMRGGQVKKGDIIGYVGNSGNAARTASHLHFAVATNPSVFDRYNGSGDLDPV